MSRKSSSEKMADYGILEAIFFSSPRPISKDRLAKILEISRKDLDGWMAKFIEEFNKKHKGVKIARRRGYYYLTIVDKYLEYIINIIEPPPLNDRQKLVIAYLYKNKEAYLKDLRSLFGPYIYRDIKKLRKWGFISIVTRDKKKMVYLRPEAEAYIIRKRRTYKPEE